MVSCALMLAILLPVEGTASDEEHERRTPPVCQTLALVGERAYSGGDGLKTTATLTPRPAEIVPAARFERASDFLSTENQKKLLESYLVQWVFYEDLSEEQRGVLDRASFKCAESPSEPPLAGTLLFERFDVSQRATFVAVTHAMLNTPILDLTAGGETSDTLALVEELTDVHGGNPAMPSDEQYQVYVRLFPDALKRLQAAKGFAIGENHVFHPGYPLSFRQIRQFAVRGREAGLHISVSRDGRSAVIHVDYRFGLLHLGPANSDVRAPGNHEKHVDRWPQAEVTARNTAVRRVVLHRMGPRQHASAVGHATPF